MPRRFCTSLPDIALGTSQHHTPTPGASSSSLLNTTFCLVHFVPGALSAEDVLDLFLGHRLALIVLLVEDVLIRAGEALEAIETDGQFGRGVADGDLGDAQHVAARGADLKEHERCVSRLGEATIYLQSSIVYMPTNESTAATKGEERDSQKIWWDGGASWDRKSAGRAAAVLQPQPDSDDARTPTSDGESHL